MKKPANFLPHPYKLLPIEIATIPNPRDSCRCRWIYESTNGKCRGVHRWQQTGNLGEILI
ncbi:hypothetical protein KIN20_013574, partial [Parelaphostrongylus tenuis]